MNTLFNFTQRYTIFINFYSFQHISEEAVQVAMRCQYNVALDGL